MHSGRIKAGAFPSSLTTRPFSRDLFTCFLDVPSLCTGKEVLSVVIRTLPLQFSQTQDVYVYTVSRRLRGDPDRAVGVADGHSRPDRGVTDLLSRLDAVIGPAPPICSTFRSRPYSIIIVRSRWSQRCIPV